MQVAPWRLVVISGLIALLGAMWAHGMPAGSVWRYHLDAGRDLLAGRLPYTPTYPIWGYSLLAAGVGDVLIWIQAFLATTALALWWRVVTMGAGSPGGLLASGRWPGLTAFLMAPWLLLATSYYSNSMGSILALFGFGALWWYWDGRRGVGWLVLAGVCFGLGANIRGEYLMIAGLMAVGLVVCRQRGVHSTWGERIVRAAVFLAAVIAMMVPWMVYTAKVTGAPRLTAANGAVSIYQGLGTLPGNPWGIVPTDEASQWIARRHLGAEAWSQVGERYFSAALREAIRQHPDAALRRVLHGWRAQLMQGLYIPNLRAFVATDERDEVIMGLALETLRQGIGAGANSTPMERARELGLGLSDLTARHVFVLAAELSLRAIYGLVFLGLVGAAGWLCWRGRIDSLQAWTVGVLFFQLLFVSGVVYALPRHSTLILPVLVGVLLRARATASSGRT